MVCLLVILVKVFDAAATVKTVPPSLILNSLICKDVFSFFSASFAPFLHFLLFGHFFLLLPFNLYHWSSNKILHICI